MRIKGISRASSSEGDLRGTITRTTRWYREDATAGLTGKFKRLTRGLYDDSPAAWEAGLDSFISANGNFKPSRWRDPFGLARNRGGERIVPDRQRHDELEIIKDLQADADRE